MLEDPPNKRCAFTGQSVDQSCRQSYEMELVKYFKT